MERGVTVEARCGGKAPVAASGSGGFSLLIIVVGLVIVAALGAVVASLTPRAALTTVAATAGQRATCLAASGLAYWSPGRSGRFELDGGDSFTLSTSPADASGYVTVSSLGTALSGTPLEANTVLSARRWGLSPVTFATDLASFTLPTAGAATTASAVTIFAADSGGSVSAADTLAPSGGYAGGWLRLGDGINNVEGATWYGGDHGSCATSPCPAGLCAAGKCTLGQGLRARFGFAFARADTSSDSRGYGDGFTFTLMRGDNDPATAAGGGLREYLGYAGPGASGTGIPAPKLAVELDIYPNNRQIDPTKSNSRADGPSNHVAVVYWGDSALLLDDNVHGAGTSPRNPASGEAGYYGKADAVTWLEDGQEHAVRLEIDRATDAGQGVYTVRVWVDPTGAGSADVTRDYTAEEPQVLHTARLSAADHAKFDTVYFGFTAAMGAGTAAGGAAQSVALHDFSLDFRR